MKKHLLFICSSNIDRSPAAEALFENSDEYKAKSAGVGLFCNEEKRVTEELVDWADEIFVMDERVQGHKILLLKEVPGAIDKPITILDISNDFMRYNPELEKILRGKLSEYL